MEPERLGELSLLSMPFLIGRDSAMRHRILKLGESAARVLSSQGFSPCDLPERFAKDPDGFVIRLGDLTEPGLQFGRTGFQRWLGNTDRWRTDPPVEKYVQALERQVAAFNKGAV